MSIQLLMKPFLCKKKNQWIYHQLFSRCCFISDIDWFLFLCFSCSSAYFCLYFAHFSSSILILSSYWLYCISILFVNNFFSWFNVDISNCKLCSLIIRLFWKPLSIPRGAPIAITALLWVSGTGQRNASRFAAERLVLSFFGIYSLCIKLF